MGVDRRAATGAAGGVTRRLPRVVLLLPACFIVETILGGPFGNYGGISVRLLLLAASCAVLLFAVLVRGRVAGSHLVPILSVSGFAILNGIWVAVVPVMMETNMHWSLREPYAFVVLIPVVLMLAVLEPEQLPRVTGGLQRLVVVTSVVLAIFQVGLWVIGTLFYQVSWVVPLALDALFRGAGDQLFVGRLPDGFFRVFWISTLWCLLGFFWTPVAFSGFRLRRLLQGILLMDLFVTYSRGIWIGLAIGLLVAEAVTVTRRTAGRTLMRFAAASVITVSLLIGVLAAAGALEPWLARFASTTSRDDPSIGARIEQAPHLLQLWYEHPVVGSGYGAFAPGYVRSEEAPYSYEHMPYALLAKLGLLGVVLSGAFLAGWALTAWEARRWKRGEVASLMGSGAALLFAEMTNPMVLNFVSMTIFACLLLQWAALVRPAMPASAAPAVARAAS